MIRANINHILRVAACCVGTAAGTAEAAVTVFVEPQTTTTGQAVAVSGSSDCTSMLLDFGDGTPAQVVAGPGPYATMHVYASASPSPPGVWLVTAQGTACATAIDSASISVIVGPGIGGESPVVSPAGPVGTLRIERLGLRFENGRPAIRVRQNESGVQVFADVHYTGTGLLQGYWEVDGAIWSIVNRHLVFGDVVAIESAGAPGLPTIDPGLHRVRFVLMRPAGGFDPPLALYFAGYEEARRRAQVNLVAPMREARVPYRGARFGWAVSGDVASYRLTFFDADTGEPIFAALTRSDGYALDERVLEERFDAQRRYEWQVIAFDADGGELTRSTRRAFTLNAGRTAQAGLQTTAHGDEPRP